MSGPDRKLPGLFAQLQAAYRAAGFTAVPVGNAKAPLGTGWQKLDPSDEEVAQRLRRYPDANIGLLAGTKLATGNVLGFADCDDDRFMPFALEALGPLVSGKVGQKGITLFIQSEPALKSLKLRAHGSGNKPVLELMLSSGMVVLPPSRHPAGMDYQWAGKPLLDIDPLTLPLLTAEKAMQACQICEPRSHRLKLFGFAAVKTRSLASAAEPIRTALNATTTKLLRMACLPGKGEWETSEVAFPRTRTADAIAPIAGSARAWRGRFVLRRRSSRSFDGRAGRDGAEMTEACRSVARSSTSEASARAAPAAAHF